MSTKAINSNDLRSYETLDKAIVYLSEGKKEEALQTLSAKESGLSEATRTKINEIIEKLSCPLSDKEKKGIKDTLSFLICPFSYLPEELIVYLFSFFNIKKEMSFLASSNHLCYRNVLEASKLQLHLENRLSIKELDQYKKRLNAITLQTVIDHCHSLRKVTFGAGSKDEECKNLAEALEKNESKQLSHLNLFHSNQITPVAFTAIIKKCPKLTHLHLKYYLRLTNECLISLAPSFSNLKYLSFEGCTRITSGTFQKLLPYLSKLTLLNLSGCYRFTNQNLSLLVSNCPELISLNLTGCYSLTNTGLLQLKSLSLTHLDLTCCRNITSEGLLTLMRSLLLVHLSIEDCFMNDTSVVEKISVHFQKLESLNLSRSHAITDKSLKALALNAPKLKEIKLSACNITFKGLESLAASCPLKKIDLSRCTQLTVEELSKFIGKCPTLKVLTIDHCGQISNIWMQQMKAQHPNVIINNQLPSPRARRRASS
jgi:hypothetical protein